MELLALELVLGFAIGLSLGLLGGGGSILMVPALVYLIGQSPQAAVTTSLVIVGANSLVGALAHYRQRTLVWPVALVFGGVGMVSAFLSGGLSRLFAPAVLMVAFAVLMLLIGALLLSGAGRQPDSSERLIAGWGWVTLAGVGVGVLTGILGVGGGFLIVPALVLLVRLPMQQAVGTSLVVITANSLAGLLGRLNAGPLDLSLVFVFGGVGLFGALAGARLARRMPVDRLRQAFAVFVIVLAIFLLLDNAPKLLV
ncbi:MAG: sulfite exporter TauE/SafE family protein [Anaerolineae bacterium]